MKQFLAFFAVMVVLGLILDDHWKVLLGLFVLCSVSAVSIPLAAQVSDAIAHAYKARQKARQKRAEDARMERGRMSARASLQHDVYLNGDSRGIYGEFPPVDLDKL